MKKITCFGEVLWDVFPTHKKIGGAPLNVAVRLSTLGNDTSIISRVGMDQDGENILSFLKDKNVNIKCVQKDNSLKTGSVGIYLDEGGSAIYTIDFPRAWDYIDFEEKAQQEVQKSDAFIYGSLTARNEHTQNTLLELIKHSKYNVFDVNLRSPHYTEKLLIELMQKADFIKFNDDEIIEIAKYLGFENQEIKKLIKFIAFKTNTSKICVTRGGNGAILLHNNQFYEHKGFKVKVMNTVGAGDSFLASLIHCLLRGNHPNDAIEFACAVGALVANSDEANPELSIQKINSFKQHFD